MGDEGDDSLRGGGGADFLNGGIGEDELWGSVGDDTLDGGADSDTLYGDSGADVLNGGAGDDTLRGGSEDDLLDGGDGADSLFGGSENDTLTGGQGSDRLDGEAGDDSLNGGEGDDRLFGGTENDLLSGGAGDDEIDGGPGDDEVDYSQAIVDPNAESMPGVSVNLVAGSATGEGSDTLTDVELVTGSSGKDQFEISGSHFVRGGPGDDSFVIDGVDVDQKLKEVDPSAFDETKPEGEQFTEISQFIDAYPQIVDIFEETFDEFRVDYLAGRAAITDAQVRKAVDESLLQTLQSVSTTFHDPNKGLAFTGGGFGLTGSGGIGGGGGGSYGLVGGIDLNNTPFDPDKWTPPPEYNPVQGVANIFTNSGDFFTDLGNKFVGATSSFGVDLNVFIVETGSAIGRGFTSFADDIGGSWTDFLADLAVAEEAFRDGKIFESLGRYAGAFATFGVKALIEAPARFVFSTTMDVLGQLFGQLVGREFNANERALARGIFGNNISLFGIRVVSKANPIGGVLVDLNNLFGAVGGKNSSLGSTIYVDSDDTLDSDNITDFVRNLTHVFQRQTLQNASDRLSSRWLVINPKVINNRTTPNWLTTTPTEFNAEYGFSLSNKNWADLSPSEQAEVVTIFFSFLEMLTALENAQEAAIVADTNLLNGIDFEQAIKDMDAAWFPEAIGQDSLKASLVDRAAEYAQEFQGFPVHPTNQPYTAWEDYFRVVRQALGVDGVNLFHTWLAKTYSWRGFTNSDDDSTYNIDVKFEGRLRDENSTVSAAGPAPTATVFRGTGGLSGADGCYNGAIIRFTVGPLAGQRRLVTDYIGGTREFTTNAFTASPGANDAFVIEQTPNQQVILNAASIWERVITADVTDAMASGYGVIDDLLYVADTSTAPTLFGAPGDTLAASGPKVNRSGQGLPMVASMTIDESDLGRSLVGAVVVPGGLADTPQTQPDGSSEPELFRTATHEMAHGLGFVSSRLQSQGLTVGVAGNERPPRRFTVQNAISPTVFDVQTQAPTADTDGNGVPDQDHLGLDPNNGFYNNSFVRFTSGAASGQLQQIQNYTVRAVTTAGGTTTVTARITLTGQLQSVTSSTNAASQTPGVGDDFVIEPGFTGANAVAQFNTVFGGAFTAVPMEGVNRDNVDSGGNAARGEFQAHWSEGLFDTEIMTPLKDGAEPVSVVTIAALADLGYTVNLNSDDKDSAGASAFSPPTQNAGFTLLGASDTEDSSTGDLSDTNQEDTSSNLSSLASGDEQGFGVATIDIAAGVIVFEGSIFADRLTLGESGGFLTHNASRGDFANATDVDPGPGYQQFNLTTATDVVIVAGAGNDEIDASGIVSTSVRVIGGLGNDVLKGTSSGSPQGDRLDGGPGDDVLVGLGGDDVLLGGDGRDQIEGGAGNDRLEGGAGSDVIAMGTGVDEVDGGDGSDVLVFETTAGDILATKYGSNVVLFGAGDGSSTGLFGATDVEDVRLATLTAGASSFRIGDLSGTSVSTMGIELISGLAAGDVLEIDGSGNHDTITLGFSDTYLISAPTVVLPWGKVVFAAGPSRGLLKVNGLGGDDDIRVVDSQVEDKIAITLDGGHGNDFLSADAVLIGGPGNDFLEGGAGDDQLFGNAGEDTMVGNGGKDTYDGGPDFDTILVEGTSDNDVIDVRQTAADTMSSTVNGTADVDETMVDVEEVRIEAGEGDDLIRVSVIDNLETTTPGASLRFSVVGDAPNASDRLVVVDDGLGDLVLYRKGSDSRSGSITIGPLAPVTFSGIERTDIYPLQNSDLDGNGDTGANGHGRLVVFEPDPFELNDTRRVATPFEFLERVAVRPTIDPGGIADAFGPGTAGLPGDEDWYVFVAPKTGTFRFDLLFEAIPTLANGRAGLPGNGDLELEIYGVNSATNALERLAVGVPSTSGQAAAVGVEEGESYWTRVRGVTPADEAVSQAVNLFDLQAVEMDLFGPQVTDVYITSDAAYDLFDPKPSIDGPTPLVNSLTIELRDLVHREPGFLYPALNQAISEDPGHYLVVGDHNGVIPIQAVNVTNDPVAAPTNGTVTAALSAVEFGDAALAGSPNDFYNGDLVRFLDGPLVGQEGVIIDYVSDGTFRFAPTSFTGAPVVGNSFQILDLATASIELVFGITTGTATTPLPDDRFTLTIIDGVVDPAENNLDGESNSVEPQEAPNFFLDAFDLFGEPGADGLADGSGDGVPGGEFVARFTVDSRPEVGVWSAGSVYVDTNGNFSFDPQNADHTNRDLTYNFGFTSDHVFAGNFAPVGGTADGFDKLAAYGMDANGNARWLVDTSNNGVPNINQLDTPNIIGMPVAGDFNRTPEDGDEVGLYDGTSWFLDTDRNFQVNNNAPISIPGMNNGFPIVGDFDGDGNDDLATYNLGTFTFALSDGAGGWLPVQQIAFNYGNFIGDRERPVAADMDGDGIDDIGLWVPDRSGVASWESGEWYFLISDDFATPPARVAGTVNMLNHNFSPFPLGNDLFAQFGDEFAVPIVGNFDPPVAGTGGGVSTVLKIDGTEGDDEFFFSAGSDGQTWTVTVNGVAQDIPAGTESILFNGGDGRDTGFLRGSDKTDVFVSNPAGATLSGTGFAVTTQSVEITHGYGMKGNDIATLNDSSGSDKFKAKLMDDYAKMMGGEYYTRAKFFENVTGVFSKGDDDYARVWDSNDSDHMTASPEGLTLTTDQFTVNVENYDRLLAYSNYGGEDTVDLYDSEGKDTMRARSHKTLFWGPGFDMTLRGWENVIAHSENGGDDWAKLHDTLGDDVVLTGDDWASLSTVNDNELDLLYAAYGFEVVKAYHTEGHDKAPAPSLIDFLMLDDENAWDLQ